MKRCGAVVLAAGGSSRLGRPKQLLTLEGESLLHRVARMAVDAGFSPVVVVLGAVDEPCRRALEGLPVDVVKNARWVEGLGSSVAAGIGAVTQCDGALLLPCDQPGLTVAALRRLADAFTGSGIVASRYAGTTGTPVLFSSAHFTRLRALTGDIGAKSLLRQFAREVTEIDMPEAQLDIDSEVDWQRVSQAIGD